jgi:hypothetical protein
MDQKPCRGCGESILASATRCPKCQSFQSAWKNPQVLGMLFVIPIALLPLFMFRGLRDHEFADYRDQLRLQIDRIEREKRQDNSGTEIIVLGKIENSTRMKWENPVFEVIVQSEKKLADAVNEELYQFVIIPDAENSFRLKINSIAENDSIDDVTVTLKNASADRF